MNLDKDNNNLMMCNKEPIFASDSIDITKTKPSKNKEDNKIENNNSDIDYLYLLKISNGEKEFIIDPTKLEKILVTNSIHYLKIIELGQTYDNVNNDYFISNIYWNYGNSMTDKSLKLTGKKCLKSKNYVLLEDEEIFINPQPRHIGAFQLIIEYTKANSFESIVKSHKIINIHIQQNQLNSSGFCWKNRKDIDKPSEACTKLSDNLDKLLCPICCENIADITLSCIAPNPKDKNPTIKGHSFCEECINHWANSRTNQLKNSLAEMYGINNILFNSIKANLTCPICREECVQPIKAFAFS